MFLLDTNVVSELRKRAPHPGVVAWFETAEAEDLFVSPFVVGEVRQGIERLRSRDSAQAEALSDWLETLKSDFAGRILDVTTAVGETWGRLNAGARLPEVDGVFAATALVHDLTLVTRDTSGLERTGVRLLNPWET